jgi:hypothetical protein
MTKDTNITYSIVEFSAIQIILIIILFINFDFFFIIAIVSLAIIPSILVARMNIIYDERRQEYPALQPSRIVNAGAAAGTVLYFLVTFMYWAAAWTAVQGNGFGDDLARANRIGPYLLMGSCLSLVLTLCFVTPLYRSLVVLISSPMEFLCGISDLWFSIVFKRSLFQKDEGYVDVITETQLSGAIKNVMDFSVNIILKASVIFYFPLAFIANSAGSDIYQMKRKVIGVKLSSFKGVVIFFSLFVIACFAFKILLYGNINGLLVWWESCAAAFFLNFHLAPREFNLWHITSLLSAAMYLITVKLADMIGLNQEMSIQSDDGIFRIGDAILRVRVMLSCYNITCGLILLLPLLKSAKVPAIDMVILPLIKMG